MKTIVYLSLIALLTIMPYVFVSATLGEWNVMNMSPRQQGIIGIGGGILLFIACAMTVIDIWERRRLE